MSSLTRFGVLFLLTLAAGCTRYEYDIVRPPELAQHIGSKSDVTVEVPPLRYKMIAVDNHLVLRIYNDTPDPIRLLGDQSTAVDPRGQSHPLRSQTIAPGSFIKLILPPLPPRVEPTGPRIGIGIGGAFGSARPFHRGYGFGWGYDSFYDPWYDSPRYYAVYDDDSGMYWSWPDEGEVKLVLTYQRGDDKPFSHEFAFRQKKA